MLRYLTVTASGIALAMTSPALALANPGKGKKKDNNIPITTVIYASSTPLIRWPAT